MKIGIVIVAHSPMASALYSGGIHCFQQQPAVFACDVSKTDSPEASRNAVQELIVKADTGGGVLILTDIVGASPSNAAVEAAAQARRAGHCVALVAGANTPMLLRALTYRNLPLEDMADRVLAGGHQAILRVE